MGYVLALVKDGDEAQLRRRVCISADIPIIMLSSIREARKVAESVIPDAVLIERGLPDGWGIEFLHFLNSYPSPLAKIPITIVPGSIPDPHPTMLNPGET